MADKSGKKREREELPDDTIADMDLEGMPWNSRRPWQLMPGDPARWRRAYRAYQNEAEYRNREQEPPNNTISARETLGLIRTGLKAGLLIGGVFAGAGLLFILFCVFVWFR